MADDLNGTIVHTHALPHCWCSGHKTTVLPVGPAWQVWQLRSILNTAQNARAYYFTPFLILVAGLSVAGVHMYHWPIGICIVMDLSHLRLSVYRASWPMGTKGTPGAGWCVFLSGVSRGCLLFPCGARFARVA